MARTRKDAWKLAAWDDTFLWYSRAVGEMLKRKIADPTSWRYQAAIHEYSRTRDPLRKFLDRLPSVSEQRRYWTQCQHNSWFFLPWHRWYLWYFEEIVGATIVKLGGPANWALPYWNYSDSSNPDARRIPQAFVDTAMPDGSPNALFVSERDFGNDGAAVGDDADVDLTCLEEPNYIADEAGGSPGFGGPETAFNHGGGPFGALEGTPHGSMHVAVNGWLGGFNTAGLDPLFWLHHCNIDRLWVVWRNRDASHIDPTESSWLNLSFDFHSGGGKAISRKVGDAVDTNAIGYDYEDTSDPLVVSDEAVEAPRRRDRVAAMRRIPEMVGASEAPTPLTTAPTTASVPVSAPTGPGLESLEAPGGEPQRVYINIENITGHGKPRRYEVYVNGVFAGILPLFGVQEATEENEEHAGGGLHYRLDATKAVQQLKAEGKWDPAKVDVTFVPDSKRPASAGLESMAEAAEPRFEVGRVSVFVK
jgi:tyrosinase